MAITMVSKRISVRNIKAGQEGFSQSRGVFAFSTTDANGTIQTGLRKVEDIILTPGTAPNTDEQLYIVRSADGSIPITNGVITIARTGTKTSGLKFSAVMQGYAS